MQTNVLELLCVDDILPGYAHNEGKGKKGAVAKVLEQDIDEYEELNEMTDMVSNNLVSNVLGNFEGYQEKKKRKKLPPSRVRQLPQFEINDIIGNFDIDEDGNYIIVRNG